MATPAVIIRAIETLHIKIGDSYFVHSKKETSVCLPLDKVEPFGDSALWIKPKKGMAQLLLNQEIVEVQFIQGE